MCFVDKCNILKVSTCTYLHNGTTNIIMDAISSWKLALVLISCISHVHMYLLYLHSYTALNVTPCTNNLVSPLFQFYEMWNSEFLQLLKTTAQFRIIF